MYYFKSQLRIFCADYDTTNELVKGDNIDGAHSRDVDLTCSLADKVDVDFGSCQRTQYLSTDGNDITHLVTDDRDNG